MVDEDIKKKHIIPKKVSEVKTSSNNSDYITITAKNDEIYSVFEDEDRDLSIKEIQKKLGAIINADMSKTVDIGYITRGEYRNIEEIDNIPEMKEKDKPSKKQLQDIKDKYRAKQIVTMEECFNDAEEVKKEVLNPGEISLSEIAIAMFEKRTPPYHYFKKRELEAE